jgi:hypothetical protein
MGGAQGKQKKGKKKRWPSLSLIASFYVWLSSSLTSFFATRLKKPELELECFFAIILR